MEGWRGHGQTRRSNCGLGTMEKGALWDSSEKALASMGSGSSVLRFGAGAEGDWQHCGPNSRSHPLAIYLKRVNRCFST